MYMNPKSFSFRRTWLEAVNKITDAALRAEIISTVVNYGLTGELAESSSDVVNAMAALIISQIPRKRAPRQQEQTESDTAPSAMPEPEPTSPVSSDAPSASATVAELESESAVADTRPVRYKVFHPALGNRVLDYEEYPGADNTAARAELSRRIAALERDYITRKLDAVSLGV